MRSGHVRTVQNTSTLYTNVSSGSVDNVGDPTSDGGRMTVKSRYALEHISCKISSDEKCVCTFTLSRV